METVLNDIIQAPLALKKTRNIFPETTEYCIIIRVDNFYIENKNKFVWLTPWKGNVYTYGNPFPSYNF